MEVLTIIIGMTVISYSQVLLTFKVRGFFRAYTSWQKSWRPLRILPPTPLAQSLSLSGICIHMKAL